MGRLLDLKQKFDQKEIGFEEYYRDFLSQVETRNQKTNTYLEVFSEDLLSEAKKLDQGSGRGRLRGLPIAIKDMISIQNRRLSAASRMLEGYVAPRSATVTERLSAEGALFVGRTNCDEFAMGSSNENSAYGPVRNPLDLERTAGGSSGGSAAAVVGEMCVASLGTDTGGSIRLPASYCGITGLKPTYGRVSRSGVIAFASSLDQVGPMAEDAADCAEVLQIIAGKDSRDSTSMPVPVPDYAKEMSQFRWKGKKVGLPKEFFQFEGLDPDTRKALDQVQESLKKEGAEFVEISLPSSVYGIAAYYLVATAEASSNLARYDGIRFGHQSAQAKNAKELIIQSRSEGFGPEVKRRILLGSFALSAGYFDAYYSKAQFIRSKIQSEYLQAFESVDLIFAPASPQTAFRLGEKQKDPLKLYLMDVFTVSVNLAGLCAISFPIAADSNGLPIGAQWIGKAFAESELLGATWASEKLTSYKKGALAC